MPISVNAMRCRATRARPSATALLLIAVIRAELKLSSPVYVYYNHQYNFVV